MFAVSSVACTRDLALPDPPPVTGFVTGRVVAAVPGTSQSAPLPGASVTLLSSNLHATTDARGQFLLGPLPEGTYRLFFASKVGGVARQRLLTGVKLKPGATNSVGDVSIQENALLTGRALIQGRTSGNVGITIFSPGTDYVTTSADNGGWLLGNLPEGSIRASAWRPGFSPSTTTDISLQGGVVTSAVDMILEPEDASSPPGAILGKVRVLGKDDSAGVTVKAVSVQSQTVKTTTTTDADGNFILRNLTADLYTVTLELSGYPRARVPNLAVAGGVQLELAETIIMAVTGDGNVVSEEPIGGPSGPLFNLDGGISSPDGGTVITDGGTVGAECADDNQCASGHLCVDNRCVGCSVNVQCRPGFSCHSGDCTRDCQSNDECSQGLACISGSCVNCITSSDCRDASLVCNPQAVCAHCRDRSECPAGKACLLTGCGTCNADFDCGPNAICEQGVCTAGDCHGNTDCGSTQACVGRNCASCSADSQCRAGQLCVSGACVPGNCRSVLDCGTGQLCLNNQCGACANDTQCGTGRLCLPGAGGLRCTAASCRLPSDCANSGELCVNNQCQACSGTNPCTNGQICNSLGRCVVGDCFTNLDCTGPKAGYACIAGNCTPCAVNTDCAASGYVCAAGTCRVGNCTQPADCAVPGQLCLNNACVGCANSLQCPTGQVCDADSLCHPGNCTSNFECVTGVCNARVCGSCTQDTQCGLGKLCMSGTCVIGNCRTRTDCANGQLCNGNLCGACAPGNTQCGSGQVCDVDGLCKTGNCTNDSNCTGGKLCLARTCTNCSADSQCTSGKICVLGGCATGVCHSDADCSAGQGLCDTNPGSGTAWTCRPCSPFNGTSGTTCGAGRVCDGAGLCHFGNCVTNGTCSGGQVCTNYSCVSCTQDSQCSSGQLCIGAACKAGNCHGTGSDPNIDCAATNGICTASNVCVGNCRANTDCAVTGYCDVNTTHLCTTCTGPGQCGVGKVCTPGGGGNTCVTAQCSSIEPNCQLGYSCVSGACLQLGPGTTSFDGGYVEPGTINGGSVAPMALSGTNTLYFSTYEPTSTQGGTGSYSVALEPNLTLRWRVKDSNSNTAKSNFAGAGIVLPAPGFPNGELFLANDGNGGAIAHRSDTGAQAWRIPFQPSAFAAGLVNGVPNVAFFTSAFGNSTLVWLRTDGSQQRQAALTGCVSAHSLAFGTKAIYVVCSEAVYLVDPIGGTFKTVPHAGNPLNTNFQGFAGASVATVWRPPNNFTARGVNVGTVTSDVLIYLARSSGDWALAVNVPDDWVTNSSSTTGWTLWTNSSINLTGTPPAIDATGAIYIGSQNRIYKLNVFTGQQISNVLGGAYTQYWNLAVNSQYINSVNNTVQGFLLADGATTTPTPLWTLPASPGPWPLLYPTFQTTLTNGGNLLAFQTSQSGQATLQSMPPGPTAPAFVPSWPATSLAGDSANHAGVPAYECTSDSQCAATQNCLLGRCVGNCRDATQCSVGLGCNLGSCSPCSTASSCRTGEVCWVGQCIACVGANCCNTNTDCASGNFCQGGSCRQAPGSGLPGGFSLPNLVTKATNGNITVAPDGTMYVGDLTGANLPFWKIVTPAGVVASTTPTIPVAIGTQGQLPMVMVASNGGGNSLWNGVATTLYSAPAASSVGSWTTATYTLFTTGFLRLAQGVSSAMTGSPRPTLYATASSGYSNGYLMAIDAATASAGGTGNPGLVWAGVLGSTCQVQGVTQLDHLLIGSDGTVYITCPDGSVQAWAADGDPSTGPPPSRLGLLKWRSAPPAGWGSITLVGRSAIGKSSSGDVMYLPRPNAAGLAVLNLATATNGSLPIELGVDASAGILTDSTGRAIVMGSQYNKELSIVQPNGAVAYDDKTSWFFSGHGAVLTAEGQLIATEYTTNPPNTQRVSGVTVASVNQVALLFSFVGAGGLSVDANTGPVVLSTSQVSTGLIAFDHVPLTNPSRTVSGFPFAGSQGPMLNAWSAWYGDQQRRNSLKTQ